MISLLIVDGHHVRLGDHRTINVCRDLADTGWYVTNDCNW